VVAQQLKIQYCAMDDVGPVTFPSPTGLNVNMMPFIMGDKCSLPPSLHCYLPLIDACQLHPKEMGRVGYLTVHESHVRAGKSHRRAGLHVDSPSVLLGVDGVVLDLWPAEQLRPRHPVGWGDGEHQIIDCEDIGLPLSRRRRGGIYMASTCADSTRVWNATIERHADIADPHGGVEKLRGLLGEGINVPASRLMWLTDLTPHESLPLAQDSYRQYFRLVTSGRQEKNKSSKSLRGMADRSRRPPRRITGHLRA